MVQLPIYVADISISFSEGEKESTKNEVQMTDVYVAKLCLV